MIKNSLLIKNANIVDDSGEAIRYMKYSKGYKFLLVNG